jgi:hypothetical protein
MTDEKPIDVEPGRLLVPIGYAIALWLLLRHRGR